MTSEGQQASVVIVRPPTRSADVEALEVECRAGARERGLAVKTYVARSIPTRGDEGWGRRISVLDPLDASALYRVLHRGPVMVVAFTAVWVRRDPRRDPPVKRAALRLQTFVAHKSIFSLVRGIRDIDEALDTYDEWRGQVLCEGERDPTVLPLHTFQTDHDWSQLGTAGGKARFELLYGKPGERRDDGDKRWKRAARGAFHGGNALTVAGRTLEAGFHWDVSIPKNEAFVCTTNAVWRVRGANGYVNVYPDAHVRAGSNSSKIWPPKRGK